MHTSSLNVPLRLCCYVFAEDGHVFWTLLDAPPDGWTETDTLNNRLSLPYTDPNKSWKQWKDPTSSGKWNLLYFLDRCGRSYYLIILESSSQGQNE